MPWNVYKTTYLIEDPKCSMLLIPLPPLILTSILMLSSNSPSPQSFKWLLSMYLLHQNSVCTCFPHPSYMSSPFLPTKFPYLNN